MTRRSRLTRRRESESKKNFALSLFGIFIVLFILIKFGIPFLANISFLLSGQSKNTASSITNSVFLSQPSLDPLPSATNSAQLLVTGKAEEGSTVNLYVNDSVIDKNQVEKDGSFKFSMTLNKGDNKIYVKVKKDSSSSLPSDTMDVFFKDSKPNLTLTSPTDGQSLSKDQNTVLVSGTTDPQTKITVNGYWAVIDQSNNFSYQLKLNNGDNSIKVVAEDIAGNKTEKDLKVTYSP
ncbi:MAG TPA: hypothetical protein VFA93_00305 [Patescibacteria group bacterium]|nr:hypothetical protein [Patescibacteria group bacterium]